MVPLGREAVEMAKAGAAAFIVMLRGIATELEGLAESVAVIVMAEVPAAVGVPVMVPVAGFIARPAGSVPVVRLQVIAPVPPIDCKAAV